MTNIFKLLETCKSKHIEYYSNGSTRTVQLNFENHSLIYLGAIKLNSYPIANIIYTDDSFEVLYLSKAGINRIKFISLAECQQFIDKLIIRG